MVHMEKSIVIDAPLAKVTALGTDPKRWHTWFAGLTEPEKITGNGEPGTVVEHHYLMMGLRFPVTSRVTEYTSTPHESQWHGTIEGPLNGKQHWSYVAEGDKTRVTARLDYTIPGSIFRQIANRLVIEGIEERNLQQTLENLKLMSEAAE